MNNLCGMCNAWAIMHEFELIMHCEIFRLRSENADLKKQLENLRKSLRCAIVTPIQGEFHESDFKKE